jgi:hypothetical protein
MNSRRNFIKKSLTILTAVPAAAVITRAGFVSEAKAQATTALPVDHPMATALGYYEDATKVDTTKWPKRAGEEGAKQFCYNCQLTTEKGLKVEGREEDFVRCAIFPDGLVTANGWCNSWVLKA